MKGLRSFFRRLKSRFRRPHLPRFSRTAKTRIVYIALAVGTVGIAYLLVLLNFGIFRLSEQRLFGNEKYIATNIISAESIGAPLSRSTRAALYARCQSEGESRNVLPDEHTEDEVRVLLESFYTDCLTIHSRAGALSGSDRLSDLSDASRYRVILRDYYDMQTGAKLGIYSAQAYAESSSGVTYCVSMEFDSRTLDPYSVTVALFDNITEESTEQTRGLLLQALGYNTNDILSSERNDQMNGSETVFRLSDGLVLLEQAEANAQIVFTLMTESSLNP